jgi:hypothetical protein
MTANEERRLLSIAQKLAHARQKGATPTECYALLETQGYDPDAALVALSKFTQARVLNFKPWVHWLPLLEAYLLPCIGVACIKWYQSQPIIWYDVLRAAFWGFLFLLLVDGLVSKFTGDMALLPRILGQRHERQAQFEAVLSILFERDPSEAVRVLLPVWAERKVGNEWDAPLSHGLQYHLLPKGGAALLTLPHQSERFLTAFDHFIRNGSGRGDLTDTRTDIVISVLQLLSRSGVPLDKALLDRVAQYPATLPNRVLVRDAARELARQNAPNTALTGTMVMGATTTPQSPLTLGTRK